MQFRRGGGLFDNIEPLFGGRGPRRPDFGNFKITPGTRRILYVAAFILLVLLVFNPLIGLYVDNLWFKSLNFQGIFTTRIAYQAWLFVAGFLVAFVVLALNGLFAVRLMVRRWSPARRPARAAPGRRRPRLGPGLSLFPAAGGALPAGDVRAAQRPQRLRLRSRRDRSLGSSAGLLAAAGGLPSARRPAARQHRPGAVNPAAGGARALADPGGGAAGARPRRLPGGGR